MFRTFRIENFRGFEHFEIDSLARINLITGRNNVGKTAFLEAVFLHLGHQNPTLPFQVNALRGFTQMPAEAEELWGWLFFEKRLERPIRLISLDDAGMRRTVDIGYRDTSVLRLDAPEQERRAPRPVGSLTTASPARELVSTYEDSAGGRASARATLVGTELKLEQGEPAGVPSGVFLPSLGGVVKEDAERFSRLAEKAQDSALVDALKIIEPRLTRLQVLVAAGVPTIYGDLGVGRLLPLPLMGHGTARLLSLVLAVLATPSGIVLVDEVGSGVHHSAMEDLWRVLEHAARAAKVQVIATTHSWECLTAAHRALSGLEEGEFALHRIERGPQGLRAVTYDRESLDGAVRAELEVR